MTEFTFCIPQENGTLVVFDSVLSRWYIYRFDPTETMDSKWDVWDKITKEWCARACANFSYFSERGFDTQEEAIDESARINNSVKIKLTTLTRDCGDGSISVECFPTLIGYLDYIQTKAKEDGVTEENFEDRLNGQEWGNKGIEYITIKNGIIQIFSVGGDL